MKTDMFQFIESAVEYIHSKDKFVEKVANECNSFFYDLLKEDDRFLNINYRIKSDSSLKEKMLRQNYFVKCSKPEDVLVEFNDIVGVRIECRFIDDERIIFENIKREFSVGGSSGFFKTEYNDNIYLNLYQNQPQLQKNGFEIYKIDGKYIEGDRELLFELQIKSMVNVFWGEIDHRILYKNFNYMITEDFIRDIMYSIKSNLEMVDNQLRTIYQRLKNIEDLDRNSTKTQLKSILSKLVHDIYILKLKNETGLLIDLRLISNLAVDFLFVEYGIIDDTVIDSQIIQLFDIVNQLNRRKMSFGESIELENLSYRNNLNKKLGDAVKKAINKDFKWNICVKIIMDISKKEDNEVFMNFIDFIVHTVSFRVEKGVENINLSKKDIHELKYNLLNAIFDFYCKELDINFFNIDDMRKLQINIEEFVEPISRPEDMMDIDMEDFTEVLKKQYQYINRNEKE
ncbi:GTP pyrophosphokinase [Miniphocaeibacter massiliensis]|uniref:GTP pyrophosphokinase n=1 Tax=Miniphocaeibacter massiliensis TaxID=2041841 RepID=UPI000C07DB4C|nr:GTP pyrophosphokinase [Miniphocaeibacter massiliensis]